MTTDIKIATKTLEAIKIVFEKDQGASYRKLLGELITKCSDAYNPKSDPFRSHLGASLIGRKCPRELWYSFRWAKEIKHSDRMIRLFNRGHLEEARFVAILMSIGCNVWQFDQNGNQWRISDVYGHFGGSLDGVALGIPDDPNTHFLTEFKTHSDKSFTLLQKEGVKIAKFEHYVQMQMYMHKMNLSVALYMAVNKNNDELHAEIIEYDKDVAPNYIKKAYFIVQEVEAPKRISNNSAWYECKFCDYRSICHGKDVPSVNCRTCYHATPLIDGSKKWRCNLHNLDLTSEQQLLACDKYHLNPQIKKAI